MKPKDSVFTVSIERKPKQTAQLTLRAHPDVVEFIRSSLDGSSLKPVKDWLTGNQYRGLADKQFVFREPNVNGLPRPTFRHISDLSWLLIDGIEQGITVPMPVSNSQAVEMVGETQEALKQFYRESLKPLSFVAEMRVSNLV